MSFNTAQLAVIRYHLNKYFVEIGLYAQSAQAAETLKMLFENNLLRANDRYKGMFDRLVSSIVAALGVDQAKIISYLEAEIKRRLERKLKEWAVKNPPAAAAADQKANSPISLLSMAQQGIAAVPLEKQLADAVSRKDQKAVEDLFKAPQKPVIHDDVLKTALSTGLFKIAGILVQHGGNPNTVATYKSPHSGMSDAPAITIAVDNGELELVETLLAAYACLEGLRKPFHPILNMAAHRAATYPNDKNRLKIVRLLLEAGCNILAVVENGTYRGGQAVHHALRHGSRPLLELLIEFGTPTHSALSTPPPPKNPSINMQPLLQRLREFQESTEDFLGATNKMVVRTLAESKTVQQQQQGQLKIEGQVRGSEKTSFAPLYCADKLSPSSSHIDLNAKQMPEGVGNFTVREFLQNQVRHLITKENLAVELVVPSHAQAQTVVATLPGDFSTAIGDEKAKGLTSAQFLPYVSDAKDASKLRVVVCYTTEEKSIADVHVDYIWMTGGGLSCVGGKSVATNQSLAADAKAVNQQQLAAAHRYFRAVEIPNEEAAKAEEKAAQKALHVFVVNIKLDQNHDNRVGVRFAAAQQHYYSSAATGAGTNATGVIYSHIGNQGAAAQVHAFNAFSDVRQGAHAVNNAVGARVTGKAILESVEYYCVKTHVVNVGTAASDPNFSVAEYAAQIEKFILAKAGDAAQRLPRKTAVGSYSEFLARTGNFNPTVQSALQTLFGENAAYCSVQALRASQYLPNCLMIEIDQRAPNGADKHIAAELNKCVPHLAFVPSYRDPSSSVLEVRNPCIYIDLNVFFEKVLPLSKSFQNLIEQFKNICMDVLHVNASFKETIDIKNLSILFEFVLIRAMGVFVDSTLLNGLKRGVGTLLGRTIITFKTPEAAQQLARAFKQVFPDTIMIDSVHVGIKNDALSSPRFLQLFRTTLEAVLYHQEPADREFIDKQLVAAKVLPLTVVQCVEQLKIFAPTRLQKELFGEDALNTDVKSTTEFKNADPAKVAEACNEIRAVMDKTITPPITFGQPQNPIQEAIDKETKAALQAAIARQKANYELVLQAIERRYPIHKAKVDAIAVSAPAAAAGAGAAVQNTTILASAGAAAAGAGSGAGAANANTPAPQKAGAVLSQLFVDPSSKPKDAKATSEAESSSNLAFEPA